jgi:hypothetical protein
MALMTKSQEKYIKDIEKNLNVKYSGSPSRKDASIFIKKYVDKNRKIRLGNNDIILPTGKQLRFIRAIEKNLGIKFRGKTFEEASLFIYQKIKKNLNCIEITDGKGRRMTYWQELKRFINHRQIGEIITRQQLMNLFRNYLPEKSSIGGYTFDKYRRYLTVIEILEHIGRGRYRINQHVAPWMNSKNVQHMASSRHLIDKVRSF